MKWIKWNPTEWLHSTCRDELLPAERATFHDYVCLAALPGMSPGQFKFLSNNSLARQLNTPVEIISSTNQKCTEQHRILITDNIEGQVCTIMNWSKYQTISDSLSSVNKKQKKLTKSVNKTSKQTRLDKIRSDKTRKDLDYIGQNFRILTPHPVDNSNKKQQFSNNFSEFWKIYPKKVGKIACWRKWRQLQKFDQLPEIKIIISAIEKQKTTDQWRQGYIPNPLTWLNQGRWDDDITTMNGCKKDERNKRSYGRPWIPEPDLPKEALEDLERGKEASRQLRLRKAEAAKTKSAPNNNTEKVPP